MSMDIDSIRQIAGVVITAGIMAPGAVGVVGNWRDRRAARRIWGKIVANVAAEQANDSVRAFDW